jgi:murein L,D-transpeptidase YcbB/YkuD
MLSGHDTAGRFIRANLRNMAVAPPAVADMCGPKTRAYAGLVAARRRYAGYVAAGGFPPVQQAWAHIRKGRKSPAVAPLRARLAAEGFAAGSGPVYDGPLQEAVAAFQAAHLLPRTGRVGRQTLERLSWKAEDKLARIDRALATLRRAIGPWEGAFLHAQIPQAFVELYQDGRFVRHFRAIAGNDATDATGAHPYATTPLASAVLSVVVNPAWRVPDAILAAEIVPRSKADVTFLETRNFKVRSGSGDSVRYVQEPGDENALGRMKLVYKNPYGQAIHGSPRQLRRLFREPVRLFSHGCIRVESSLDLAALILSRDRNMGWERLRPIVESGEETEIPLAVPLAVHVIYSTAAADSHGRIFFAPDYYGLER